jgi:hypothetical protein
MDGAHVGLLHLVVQVSKGVQTKELGPPWTRACVEMGRPGEGLYGYRG